MSLAIVLTRAQFGVQAPPVTVEVHLSNGLPSLSIVGLPETAVKESKDRVRSAIINSHLDFPARRITVNLAPADLPKEGGRYDLAIALGILAASEQVPLEGLANTEFYGELALSGELRPIKGILPASMACGDTKHQLISSLENAQQAALCKSTKAYGANSLLQVCAHLHQRTELDQAEYICPDRPPAYPNLRDVKGQQRAKRALEVAATGGHNLLFYGPPGSGKTMLASRLAGILPPLNSTQALETAAIQSLASSQPASFLSQRPFRAPHHTASAVALVGGGSNPRPGEISLAHNGILFLDELPEFQRQVLEVLREPLESGEIRISRANAQVEFPARFQLIAAMNPCPCGYFGAGDGRCRCTPDQVNRYRQKISGPLLDRFDLHVPVNAVRAQALQHSQDQKSEQEEDSQIVQQRIIHCHQLQWQRQQSNNAQLQGDALQKHCLLKNDQQQLLQQAMDKLGLSARAYHRTLRVARTIADMANSRMIKSHHISEALSYRNLDRQPSRITEGKRKAYI